jgi:hypothetical protein
MTVGELVFANVVDRRVLDTQGVNGPAGIYLPGVPGRAFPFALYRAWKIGTGMVTEEAQFYAPSGRLVHRWGPVVRRMTGTMDLTEETDLVDDAHFDETGTHLVSFIVDDEILAEIECPVFVQQAPTKLPKEYEDGLKKSDVIWVGVERDGKRLTVPAWFAYRNGRIYLVSRTEPGPQEQTVPGIPVSSEVVVVTGRKGRDTSLDEFYASVRLLEGPEWEDAAKVLADRRRSRDGAPGDRIATWRGSTLIAELTPLVDA